MLKKTVLELGGSDAYLVLEDADLDRAAEVCTKARLVNGGQSCIAGKRFIVVDAVRAEFERRFVQRMQAPRQGDPMDEGTEIGPLARRDLRHDGNNRGLGWFGPTGTWPAHRGRRLGEALLMACLADVAEHHARCEVAWIGPRAFYDKVAGIAGERRFVVLRRALDGAAAPTP